MIISMYFLSPGNKVKKKQIFHIDNKDYIIFRLERENSRGGGLAIGALKELKPVLLKEGNDEADAISV